MNRCVKKGGKKQSFETCSFLCVRRRTAVNKYFFRASITALLPLEKVCFLTSVPAITLADAYTFTLVVEQQEFRKCDGLEVKKAEAGEAHCLP